MGGIFHPLFIPRQSHLFAPVYLPVNFFALPGRIKYFTRKKFDMDECDDDDRNLVISL